MFLIFWAIICSPSLRTLGCNLKLLKEWFCDFGHIKHTQGFILEKIQQSVLLHLLTLISSCYFLGWSHSRGKSADCHRRFWRSELPQVGGSIRPRERLLASPRQHEFPTSWRWSRCGPCSERVPQSLWKPQESRQHVRGRFWGPERGCLLVALLSWYWLVFSLMIAPQI